MFQVRVDSLVSDPVQFVMNVYPENYWDSLTVGTNKTLLVEEGTSVRITLHDLNIVHTEMAPADLVYKVKSPPVSGYLEIDPPSYIVDTEDRRHQTGPVAVTSFNQAVINDGRLHYVQSIS